MSSLTEAQGLRLANVYDINAKTYLFKFAKQDGKAFLLVESGAFQFRCHIGLGFRLRVYCT